MVNAIAVNKHKSWFNKATNEIWLWISNLFTLSIIFLALALIFSIVTVFYHGQILLFLGSLVIAAVLFFFLLIIAFIVIACTTEHDYLAYLTFILPGMVLIVTGIYPFLQ